MSQIITSLLDTDWYKFTMSQAIFSTIERMGIGMPHVLYKFKCRDGADLLPLRKQIEDQISAFQSLRFSKDEYGYIVSLSRAFTPEFESALRLANLKQVTVSVFERDGQLQIEIEGPWWPAILYEVPVLAIVNECYFRGHGCEAEAHRNLFKFIRDVPEFTDFGTRRRHDKKWHEYAFKQAVKEKKCKGTSNVWLSYKHLMQPVGTMAHEWLMAFQALSKELKNFQKDALDHWLLTFRGTYGTALTDVVGIRSFLKDFDILHANNFKCLRHDSGDPVKFMRMVYEWYKEWDYPLPRLLFSDGLTPEVCGKIIDANFSTRESRGYGFDVRFGIGTNFTNNWGVKPLQIVIKLAKVNGQPVVKLSDSPGKVMCDDQEFIKRVKLAFGLKGIK